MEIGEILQVKKFNEQARLKWNKNYDAVMRDIKAGTRTVGELPQLAMYLFFDKRGNARDRGYVLKYAEDAYLCQATKRECTKEKQKRGL